MLRKQASKTQRHEGAGADVSLAALLESPPYFHRYLLLPPPGLLYYWRTASTKITYRCS